jgi:co-chaperonin GroES (HSP10)|tara:strand:- start:255 stop:509 length:255 start_codon:yes stop_codon:yes gene_type:complete
MKAIGNYIVIEEVTESSTKTGGGLELAETHREDIRYRKAKIISSGPDNLEEGQTIMFDRVAGFPVEFDEKIYKVINIRDVVAII